MLVLNFSKELRFCQTLLAISAGFFPLFLHLCQVFDISFSNQSYNLHPLVPCSFLKYYLGYLPVRCHHQFTVHAWPCRHIRYHHRREAWPCHHIPVLTQYLTFFHLVSLRFRKINLNFVLLLPQSYLFLKLTF